MDKLHIIQWCIISVLVVGLIVVAVLYSGTTNTNARQGTENEEIRKVSTQRLSQSLASADKVSHGPGQSIWVKARTVGHANESYRIPKRIIQTYKTSTVPVLMSNAIQSILDRNPNYEYIFFDDEACRTFMREKTSQRILDAYDSLIPGAYKADLFRLAVLYEYGGWYLDVSMCAQSSAVSLDVLPSTYSLVIARDIPAAPYSIYQAFIGAVPRSPVLKFILDEVVNMVLAQLKPLDPLSLTGPGAFGSLLNKFLKRPMFASNRALSYPDILFVNHQDRAIHHGNMIVLGTKYENWGEDRISTHSKHYSTLYHENQLFLKRVKRNSMRQYPHKIPVWTTWETPYVTDVMLFVMNQWETHNPDLEFLFMDRVEREQFMTQEYGDEWGLLFKTLRPGAFQADWWRMAVLYKYGGVYMDADMFPHEACLGDWVREQFSSGTPGQPLLRLGIEGTNIPNGFIVVTAQHPFLLACMEAIAKNVGQKLYPDADTAISGPRLVSNVLHDYLGFHKNWSGDMVFKKAGLQFLTREGLHEDGFYLQDHRGNKIIKYKYPGYDEERHLMGGTNWAHMFQDRTVYK